MLSMIKFKVFILVSVSALVSCKSMQTPLVAFDDLDYYASCPNTESLKVEKLMPSVSYGLIDLRIIDTLCLFMTNDSDKGFIKIGDLSDFSIKRHAVRRGNGPNELLWYLYFNEISFSHEDDTLFAYLRNNKRQISRWNISETLSSGKVEFDTLSRSYLGTMSSIYINDSLTFVTQLNNNETAIERLLYSNDKVKSIPHLSKLNAPGVTNSDGYSFNALSMIYSYNKYHEKIVEVGASQNIINIYSLNGDFKKSICIGELCEYDVNNAKSWPVAYEHLDLNDDFIAALYVDDTRYRYESKEKTLPSIRILSWEGIPLLELKIDKPATNFEFDFKNQKLYTLNSEDESFIRYDISQLFQHYPDVFKSR